MSYDPNNPSGNQPGMTPQPYRPGGQPPADAPYNPGASHNVGGQPSASGQNPYANVAPYTQPKKENTWLWIVLGVGCGGLLLLGLCGAGMGYFLYRKAEQQGSGIVEDIRRQMEEARNRQQGHGQPTPQIPQNGPEEITSLPADRTLNVTARVREYTGSQSPIANLAECAFNVSRIPRSDGTFWCNAQVVCGGQQVYGGANAGYFPCTWYDAPNAGVVGEDTQTSAADRDGSFHIDTVQHTMTIEDDARGTRGAFRLRADITSVVEQSST